MTEFMNSWQDCDYITDFIFPFFPPCIPCKKESHNFHLWVNDPFNLLLQIPFISLGSFSSVDGEMSGCFDVFFVLISDGHTFLIVFI